MRRVDWNSPAQLLEQIIHHEAVHEIDGWDDLRRRLQPDRRCFAFFHPQLPDEPLIFVEVALLPEMAGAIAPLIDKKSQPAASRRVQGGRVLLDQQLPAGPAQRVARQLPDQARGRAAQARTAAAEDLLHAVADPGAGAAGCARCRASMRCPASSRSRPSARCSRWPRCARRAAATSRRLTHANTLHALPAAAHQALWRLAALYLVQASPTAAGRPGGALSPRQRRTPGAAECPCQPVGQGPEAVVRPDGQLPLRPVASIETCHEQVRARSKWYIRARSRRCCSCTSPTMMRWTDNPGDSHDPLISTLAPRGCCARLPPWRRWAARCASGAGAGRPSR